MQSDRAESSFQIPGTWGRGYMHNFGRIVTEVQCAGYTSNAYASRSPWVNTDSKWSVYSYLTIGFDTRIQTWNILGYVPPVMGG